MWSWAWKVFSAGSIISSFSIPSNEQVSEYTSFFYHIHVLNCIIVSMVSCFLWLYCFNADTMRMTIVWNYYSFYASHIYTCFLIDESDRIAVGYICRWEGTYSGSKFLKMFKLCYHMFGRSSEVSISRFNDTNMETVKYNSGCYNVAVQVINKSRTSTCQELCIYPER